MAIFNIWRLLRLQCCNDSFEEQSADERTPIGNHFELSVKSILIVNAESKMILKSIHHGDLTSDITCDAKNLPSRKVLLKQLSRFVN